MESSFDTPILFIIFNRESTTKRVFEQIRKIKPRYLYVAADAPRSHVPEDEEKCRRTRSIVQAVDWDCQVKTLFRTQNLGCGKGPASAISWFFEQVDEGIILEDDVLPALDFFHYCRELLERYRNNPEVGIISGNNYSGKSHGSYSYYFSCYPHTWGWATWKRSWQGFDLFLDNYSLIDFKQALKWCHFRWNDRQMQLDRFKIVKKRGTDGWDWQLMFHLWRNHQYTVIPNVRLIENIGFGSDATHFKVKEQSLHADSVMPVVHTHGSILPLSHPSVVERDPGADSAYNSSISICSPLTHKMIRIRKSPLWWGWRWIRRNFLIKEKLFR
ncbi:MAG: nucleotide-diphospho-sugar transferase [Bacteroides sp.]|nr:nucleotide-diphospho-sugar transferase [Bacteroides sp.]